MWNSNKTTKHKHGSSPDPSSHGQNGLGSRLTVIIQRFNADNPCKGSLLLIIFIP